MAWAQAAAVAPGLPVVASPLSQCGRALGGPERGRRPVLCTAEEAVAGLAREGSSAIARSATHAKPPVRSPGVGRPERRSASIHRPGRLPSSRSLSCEVSSQYALFSVVSLWNVLVRYWCFDLCSPWRIWSRAEWTEKMMGGFVSKVHLLLHWKMSLRARNHSLGSTSMLKRFSDKIMLKRFTAAASTNYEGTTKVADPQQEDRRSDAFTRPGF